MTITEQRAPTFDDLRLKSARFFQIALGRQRHGQFSDRLQRVRVLLAEQSAPPFDDLLLELPRRDQPALRPQAVGEVEHGGERLGVILP